MSAERFGWRQLAARSVAVVAFFASTTLQPLHAEDQYSIIDHQNCDPGHSFFGRVLSAHNDLAIEVKGIPEEVNTFISLTDLEQEPSERVYVDFFGSIPGRHIVSVTHGLLLPIASEDGNLSGSDWLWPNRRYLVEVIEGDYTGDYYNYGFAELGSVLASREIRSIYCPGFRPEFQFLPRLDID
jgi:hypothetical protein